MKKSLVFLILVFLIILTSCSCNKNKKTIIINEQEEDEEIKIVEVDLEKSIEDVNDLDIPYYIMEKMVKTDYKKITKGSTLAKLIIKYNQSIDGIIIKEGNRGYVKNISNSTLVNVYHEAYFIDNNVSYKTKEKNDLTTIALNDYVNSYGINPFINQIEGFIINNKSLIDCKKIKEENNQYIYNLKIDGNIGGDYNKIQMKAYGNLNDYPVFSSVEMEITINRDYSISTILYESQYKVSYPVLGTANCTQTYIVTYSELNSADKEIFGEQ